MADILGQEDEDQHSPEVGHYLPKVGHKWDSPYIHANEILHTLVEQAASLRDTCHNDHPVRKSWHLQNVLFSLH